MSNSPFLPPGSPLFAPALPGSSSCGSAAHLKRDERAVLEATPLLSSPHPHSSARPGGRDPIGSFNSSSDHPATRLTTAFLPPGRGAVGSGGRPGGGHPREVRPRSAAANSDETLALPPHSCYCLAIGRIVLPPKQTGPARAGTRTGP